ncbi:hypothetical protein [Pseudomonas japonica]|uniref:Uncharacterized protein n=1 Tax=Pseudomonas japonica TaxID=256466 RepID=A0A239I2Y9_9PSED|nr:hypothetical protein [Pseudomonas japonica]SNS86704.1 hypothetical protein SAMN05444352_11725 [Pseudomonas japonica]
MVDLKGVFRIIKQFHLPTRNLLHIDPLSGHESIKSLSIRFWFENLRRRTALPTAYSLEQFFEPSSFIRDQNDSISSYRNKWIRYEDGVHRPQPALLRMVDEKCHGSARDLNHPLWRALDVSDQKILKGESFLRALAPGVQTVIFTPEDDAPLIQSARLPVTFVLLKRLVRKANLDAVACLVWLLRESRHAGGTNTGRIGMALHHVLLMMAMDLHAMKVARPLLQILVDRILPLAMQPHERVALSVNEYIEASARLNILVYRTKIGKGQSLPWSKRTRVMAKLLDITYGFDIFFAMGKPFRIDESAPGLSQEHLRLAASEKKDADWGWECLRSNRQGNVKEMLERYDYEEIPVTADT